MKTIDATGLVFTESWEGLRLTAYQDVRGVLTIGYGHTGADVHAGLVITKEQAEILLRSDMAAAVACVNQGVKTSISQAQFDALADFCFNVGRTAFLTSTLLKDVNGGSMQAAADQFLLWCNAGGKRVEGLLNRRTGERTEFLAAA